MLLEWNKDMHVGIYTIDKQHKSIVEEVNILYTMFKSDHDIKLIRKQLSKIEFIMYRHFACEFKYMSRINYRRERESYEVKIVSILLKIAEFDKLEDSTLVETSFQDLKQNIRRIFREFDKVMFEEYHNFYKNKNFIIRFFSKF